MTMRLLVPKRLPNRVALLPAWPWPLQAWCAFLSLAISACPTDEASEVICVNDADCPTGLVCDPSVAGGACRCQSNDGCELAFPQANMFCNQLGDCQPRPACIDNHDCADKPGTYCNSLSGTCILADACAASVHCPLGEICERATSKCISGCNTSADCPLGMLCLGVPGAKSCQPGECHRCEHSEQCDFGMRCELDSGTCQELPDNAMREQLCQACSYPLAPCPRGLVCMLDDAVSDGTYCAPSGCYTDNDCPSGYGPCQDIRFISQEWACQSDAPCYAMGMGPCVLSPERMIAFCACTRDEHCQTCHPTHGCTSMSGACGLDGRCTNRPEYDCATDADCEVRCKPYPAVYSELRGWPAGTGACTMGQGVCRKLKGRLCEDVLNPLNSPCRQFF